MNAIDRLKVEVAQYCVHCGSPMPWIEAALEEADELVDLIDELKPEEKAALKACFPELLRETAHTPVAALKTGKLMRRLEPHVREAFKQILYSLVTAKAQELLKPFGF